MGLFSKKVTWVCSKCGHKEEQKLTLLTPQTEIKRQTKACPKCGGTMNKA